MVGFVKKAGKINAPAATYSYSGDSSVHLYNMTYLHYAAWHKNEIAMQVLLRHGANPLARCGANKYDKQCTGKTPLQLYPGLEQIMAKIAVFGSKINKTAYCDMVVQCTE